MDEIKRMFDKYDLDGNGYLSYGEAHQALHHELGFSEEKTLKLIQVYDRNGDGRLSYEEFIWFYWKIQEKKQELQRIFKKFDRNNSNAVSFEEARLILKDFRFTDDEVRHLVEVHDIDNDGVLQYEEFVHFWNACGGKGMVYKPSKKPPPNYKP